MSSDLNCPYCLWPIKVDEAAEECAHCSARYHAECWNENGGCGTFGCPAWAASQTGQAAPPPPANRPASTTGGTTTSEPVVVTAEPLPPVGTTARRFCDMCGQQVDPGDRFCGVCGNTL